MKKLNTILLIIITIIALFFMGKWVNEVRPRYEWIEIIVKKEVTIIVDGSFIMRHFPSGYDYCGATEEIKGDVSTSTYTWCYKKQKVRIN